jgi:hypothetical protein
MCFKAKPTAEDSSTPKMPANANHYVEKFHPNGAGCSMLTATGNFNSQEDMDGLCLVELIKAAKS